MSNSNEVDASPTNQHSSQQPPINLNDTLLTLKELSISAMAADASQANETTSVNDRLQLPTTTNKTQTTAPFQPPPLFQIRCLTPVAPLAGAEVWHHPEVLLDAPGEVVD